MPHSDIKINLHNLTFSYDRTTPVLQGITFTASGQESIGLIGANGAGKSTLLKLLVGLGLGFQGSIEIEGIPVSKASLADIRSKIGYVFQDSESQLFMTTVGEDVAFAPRNYGFPPEEVEKRVAGALAQTRISHLREKSIYKLSGGEKKLASIATILSMTPDIILMDEPTVALDPGNRRNLIRIVNGLPQLKIFASHDLDFVYDTCERVILLDGGAIAADGPAKEILMNEDLLEGHGLELPLSFSRRTRESL